MDWHYLINEAEVHTYIDLSERQPVVFFKHSTRCSISAVAKQRIESLSDEITPFASTVLIDVLNQRQASNLLSVLSGTIHQSPQILIFFKSKCVFEASHLSIHAQEFIPLIQNNEI